jgi:hypothetical protein
MICTKPAQSLAFIFGRFVQLITRFQWFAACTKPVSAFCTKLHEAFSAQEGNYAQSLHKAALHGDPSTTYKGGAWGALLNRSTSGPTPMKPSRKCRTLKAGDRVRLDRQHRGQCGGATLGTVMADVPADGIARIEPDNAPGTSFICATNEIARLRPFHTTTTNTGGA